MQQPEQTPSTHHELSEHEAIDIGTVSSVEILSRSIIVLLSATAEKLGLGHEDADTDAPVDLDEARTLLNGLAGLVAGATPHLGAQANVIKDAVQGLQLAFREASAYPDKPGEGPGEKFTGPLY